MKIRVVPYRKGSQGARLLASKLSEKLGYKVFRGRSTKPGRRNILWGKRGSVAHNKIDAFAAFAKEGVTCVPNTTSKEVAQGWLKEGKTVFARTSGGQGGSGITVVSLPEGDIPQAELYTQYVKKKKEFRVHVYGDKVICVQEKRKRNGVDANPLIRSHGNGWVFCFKNIVEPDGLRVLGLAAVRAVGLDFGAVDIIYNEHQNKLYVLEVNSAPGLCPTTTEAYANAILEAV